MYEYMLSVVIITYNQEQYIAKTLNSILHQEHNYSMEIIVGDDCSIDGTRAVLEEYQRTYPNIIKVLYNERNLGIVGNYYNIIRHCRGKYIMQCAGDDYWLPGKVSVQISFLEANPHIGMCYTRVRNFYQSKHILNNRVWGGPFIDFNHLVVQNVVPAVTMAFRSKDLFKYIDDIKPETKPWSFEDYPIVLWFSLKNRIAFLVNCTSVYRVVNGSITHSKSLQKREKFYQAIYDMRAYFIKTSKVENASDMLIDARDAFLRNCYSEYFYRDRERALEIYCKLSRKNFKEYIKYHICIRPTIYNCLLLIIKYIKTT